MVLHFYGKNVTLDQVRKVCWTDLFEYKGKKVGGTHPDRVAPALTRFGVSATKKVGWVDHIKYHVSHGRPVIVLLRSGAFLWHYVVITGYTEDEIIYADPGSGARETIKTDIFKTAWSFDTDMDGVKTNNILKEIFHIDGNVYFVKDE